MFILQSREGLAMNFESVALKLSLVATEYIHVTPVTRHFMILAFRHFLRPFVWSHGEKCNVVKR
jgi:hypothetical protein